MSNTLLLTGLGNPGRRYKKTRHNIGFRIVDNFQKENSFPKFKLAKKFQAEVSEGMVNNEKVILAKPQTFMNASGRTVKALLQFYKIPPSNLIVIHDDVAILLGEIKVSQDKGAGGHKGVGSIIQEIGAQNFTRLRVGIKPKADRVPDAVNLKEFVLKKFSREEEKILKQATKDSLEKIQSVIAVE